MPGRVFTKTDFAAPVHIENAYSIEEVARELGIYPYEAKAPMINQMYTFKHEGQWMVLESELEKLKKHKQRML